MAIRKITEQATSQTIQEDAYVLVTQQETVEGVAIEVLRRVPIDVLADAAYASVENVAAVAAWMAAHPEVTTTVQDGAISRAKLDSNLQSVVDDVAAMKAIINSFFNSITDDGEGNVYIASPSSAVLDSSSLDESELS